MVRYHDGLAYRTSGKEVHSLRWPEVAVITSNLTLYYRGTPGFLIQDFRHEYRLTKTNGDQLILDDGLKDVGDEAWAIKQAVFALPRPPLVQREQAGEALTFGPVTVQRQNGLQLEGKPFAWNAVGDIQVKAGLFQVTLSDGKTHNAPVSAIPNVEMLCQVIGVKLSPQELEHGTGWGS